MLITSIFHYTGVLYKRVSYLRAPVVQAAGNRLITNYHLFKYHQGISILFSLQSPYFGHFIG